MPDHGRQPGCIRAAGPELAARRPAQQAVLGPELSVLRSEPSARGRHDHVQPHVAVRLRVRPDPVPGSGPAGRLRRDRGQYGGRAERA